MSRKVLETRDYGKFVLHKHNREVRTNSVKYRNLEEAMVQGGFKDCAPVIVWVNGEGKFQIVRGHKRFHIARKHNIPVKYQIDDTQTPIYEWERCEDPWSIKDYLDCFVREGINKDYAELKRFKDESGIPLTICISLLWRGTAQANVPREYFKGQFKIKHREFAEKVSDIIKYCSKLEAPHTKRVVFVRAITLIVKYGKVSNQVFKSKLKNHIHRLGKKATTEDYLLAIEKIYNFKQQEKVPLAFLAQQGLEKRETA